MSLRHFLLPILLLALAPIARAIDLTKATIVYNPKDAPLVSQMAQTLADDIERVAGVRPAVATRKTKGENILLATTRYAARSPKVLRGAWERFAIETRGTDLCITGSDPRGLAYGVFHVSEQIGVSPWYWFADVPVLDAKVPVSDYVENFLSPQPTIRYRGVFINDEDWGLFTWASRNYEKELGDIGPKTYDRVCELILRLKGNMLAPAMHSITGAFYSHPESQVMADKWGIMITTSHCEPLLFNNASLFEWDKQRDGEWNYETNSQTILRKLDDRIRETAQYDNIYTMGMRGLHDEAMKGSTDPRDRARTLEQVFARQREILEKYKGKKAATIPQIFVPYKETLDIYDAGLRVPDDITLIWPDDNYGYMKRVSNTNERLRKGGSGVYYHLSYLGTPHDYLWLPSTAPMLMYEELLKAYEAGADRYWLLNVGDIKPMEIETQMFFDMAYDFSRFSYDNANRYQAKWLASVFGEQHLDDFQFILDHYYRLAWDRKPEFMGYEWEWNTPGFGTASPRRIPGHLLRRRSHRPECEGGAASRPLRNAGLCRTFGLSDEPQVPLCPGQPRDGLGSLCPAGHRCLLRAQPPASVVQHVARRQMGPDDFGDSPGNLCQVSADARTLRCTYRGLSSACRPVASIVCWQD